MYQTATVTSRTDRAAAFNAVSIFGPAILPSGSSLRGHRMKQRELGWCVDPRDRAGSGRCRHRLPPLVGLFSVAVALSAKAVLVILRSVGRSMWRNPDPAQGTSRYPK
jgi:hypothetical protein